MGVTMATRIDKHTIMKIYKFSIYIFFIIYFENSSAATQSLTGEVVISDQPTNCRGNEYFNILQLQCVLCSKDLHHQPSTDGFSCTCDDRSKIVAWNGSVPICTVCGDNEVPTMDQRDCITCPKENLQFQNSTSICEHFLCPSNSLSFDRSPNSTLLDRIECIQCPKGYRTSDSGNECEPCDSNWSIPYKCCNDTKAIDGSVVCPSLELLDWPVDDSSYTITYSKNRKIVSDFFKVHLRKSIFLCQKKNLLACQMVANLCVLVLYDDDYPNSPCVLFRAAKRIPTALGVSPLPWIYYGEGDAPSVLSRRRIPITFSLSSKSPDGKLNLTAAIYSSTGSFLKMATLKGRDLQLCPGEAHNLDRSFMFLTPYKHKCTVPISQLLEKEVTKFFDLYISYQDSSNEVLHAIPVLIRNLPENSMEDRTQWALVRRFFLVDKVTNPNIARVASRISLIIKLQGRSQPGKIHVPLIVIYYTEIGSNQVMRDEKINLEFSVVYEMPGSLSHTIEVCMGVVSAMAVVWAGIRTWSHSKRSGHVGIDLFTLGHLFIFVCGYLANVFFIISFGASVVLFIFFKGQSAIHLILPSTAEEDLIRTYAIVAFSLKVVEVLFLTYSQVTVDIFLVDWERPRGSGDYPVSIWRTYFVANEWNEIQTMRKINLNLHLLISIILMQVLGLEGWGSAEPQLNISWNTGFGIPSSFTCRFASGGLVYLGVYLLQWLIANTVYERYIKNGIHEFVDLCSMANISVFILAQARYGFYIHGRSAHGFADTDIHNIVTQLRREEEDLVGHRGLLPGTEQQTFEMTVPTALRDYYNKVMAPLNTFQRKVRVPHQKKLEKESADRSVEAYHNMNRFLGAFFDHALKDLDYEVREKMFAEALLGIEFTDGSEKGVLYTDNGHSFDQVLWYGNEQTLLAFDLFLFSFCQIISHDFFIATAVTGVVGYILAEIRKFGGRLNLAKKTLTDDRFLI